MNNQQKYNPNFHHRRSIRLRGYDYTQQGLYFITICCHQRKYLFGNVGNGEMILNNVGKIAQQCWLEIPQHFTNVILHEFVIMPNHLHGIVEFVGESVGANQHSSNNVPPRNNELKNNIPQNPPLNGNIVQTNQHSSNNETDNRNGANVDSPLRSPSKTIGSMVRGFKIGVVKLVRKNTDIVDVWQRNYYENIIRNEKSYHNISQYIINNPKNWNGDKFYVKQK